MFHTYPDYCYYLLHHFFSIFYTTKFYGRQLKNFIAFVSVDGVTHAYKTHKLQTMYWTWTKLILCDSTTVFSIFMLFNTLLYIYYYWYYYWYYIDSHLEKGTKKTFIWVEYLTETRHRRKTVVNLIPLSLFSMYPKRWCVYLQCLSSFFDFYLRLSVETK